VRRWPWRWASDLGGSAGQNVEILLELRAPVDVVSALLDAMQLVEGKANRGNHPEHSHRHADGRRDAVAAEERKNSCPGCQGQQRKQPSWLGVVVRLA